MAIYKSKHASNYTVIPNDIFESGIEFTSISLLVYLLSLPPDWVIYKTTLHKKLGIGRDKLNTMFQDLKKHGYIISVQKQTRNGAEWEHIVYDKPFNGEKGIGPNATQPITENPLTDTPLPENPQLLSTNIQSTNIQSKNESNIYNGYSQNLFDKEEIDPLTDWLETLNLMFDRSFKPIDKVKKAYNARIKDGYTPQEMLDALENVKNDKYHIETKYKYVTPEFMTRPDKLEKFKNHAV